MRYYWQSLIDDTTLTASSSPVGQDIDNLKVPQLARDYTFSSNNESVVIAFSVATEIKSFIVDRGNLTAAATVTLQGNATDAWGAPSYSQAMTYTGTAFYLDLDETYKYYRLKLVDAAVTTISIGYIHLGPEYTQMPPISNGAQLFYATTNEPSFSISNQVFANEGYEYLETTFEFTNISDSAQTILGKTIATRSEILVMWSAIRNTQPLWAMLWEENLDVFPPVFCVLNQSNLNMQKQLGKQEYKTQITLREVH